MGLVVQCAGVWRRDVSVFSKQDVVIVYKAAHLFILQSLQHCSLSFSIQMPNMLFIVMFVALAVAFSEVNLIKLHLIILCLRLSS